MTEISTTARRQNHATEIVSTSVESIEVGEKEKTLPETEVSAFPEKVSPEKLSEIVPEESTEVSISTESPVSDLPKNQISESAPPPYENKTRPPISILPEDPKEKRKCVIKMVLEKIPNLSLNYSNKNVDYFTCLTSCYICNKVHKKENLEGEWGSGDYVNTRTYRLKCWGNKYQNLIQIVTVKA